MGKLVLLFGGIFTVIFGLSFIFAPHYFFELYTGAALSTSSAATDMRTTYGGFSFGFGLFLIYSAFNNVRSGLTASLLALAGIIPARLIGLALDGAPNQYMFIFLGLEFFLLVLTLLALRRPST